MASSNQWPPPIQREALTSSPEGDSDKYWLRPFLLYLKLLYFVFAVLLICFFVPPIQEAIGAAEDSRRFRPPPFHLPDFAYFLLVNFYFADPFRFTAGCLVAASSAGSLFAFWQFAVAVNSHKRIVPATCCFFASLLPGPLAYYLIYLEFGYLH